MFDFYLPIRKTTRHLRRARRERAETIAIRLRAAATAVREGMAAFAASRARRRLHRQTVRELQGLNDRTLRDIGIPRGAIWAVANELVNGVAGTGPVERTPAPRLGRESADGSRVRPRGPVPVAATAGCG